MRTSYFSYGSGNYTVSVDEFGGVAVKNGASPKPFIVGTWRGGYVLFRDEAAYKNWNILDLAEKEVRTIIKTHFPELARKDCAEERLKIKPRLSSLLSAKRFGSKNE